MSEIIRVILADDHALVLDGLKGLLDQAPDIEVVAITQDGEELLQLLEEHDVDVAVIDLQMPYHGLKVLEEIRKRELSVRTLVLTAFGDGESIQKVLELDAQGIALKTESPNQTVEAIRQVAQGRLIFPQAAQRWIAAHRKTVNDEPTQLSPREEEVMTEVARGLTNYEISKALSVSENTVRFHLKNIFEKLQVNNRTEATAWHFNRKQH